MNNSIKSEREQALAMGVFSGKIRTLDERFREFIRATDLNGHRINSLNELIVLKFEPIQDFIHTEMIFHSGLQLPFEVKNVLIEEFSFVFRD